MTAAFLMLSGLAFLGALAGSPALLGVSDDAPVGDDDPKILAEIRALRRQVEALSKGTPGTSERVAPRRRSGGT